MLSVMCCGCQRLLSTEGTLIGEPVTDGGTFDIAQLMLRLSTLRTEGLAEFGNKEACDTAALKAGWTVRDPDGTANHRCPDCRIRVEPQPGTGAYIDWGSA